jgi:hypothetical protein
MLKQQRLQPQQGRKKRKGRQQWWFSRNRKGFQQKQALNNSRNANNTMNVKIAETPATAGTQVTEGLPTTVELQEERGCQYPATAETQTTA